VTGRRYRQYPRRDSAWFDWSTGGGVTGGAGATVRPFKLAKRAPLSAILRSVSMPDVPVVYLCGPLPGGARGGIETLRAWAYRPLPEGWSHGRHYWPDTGGAPVLRYRGPEGRRLDLHLASSWFGRQDVTPAGAVEAMGQVTRALDVHANHCPVLGTPVQTGLAAIDRLCGQTDMTPWDEDFQAFVRTWSGQHRMEWVAPGRELPQVVEVDMTLAYGALAWGLGAGAPVEYPPEWFGRVARAWWTGSVTVPEDWARPYGLLPLATHAGAWEWPSTPGRTFWGLWGGSELAVAVEAGWQFRPEMGLGPVDQRATPLDRWARTVCQLAHAAELAGERLAYQAYRAILVQGIGGLVARPAPIYGVTGDPQFIPAEATPGSVHKIGPGTWTWSELVDARRGDLAHPEWAAAIWSRCRARLLAGPHTAGAGSPRTGVLSLPDDHVAGFRGDALYLTEDPGWPNDGRPGQWRVKSTMSGPVTFRGLGELDRARRG
jgi:hypothetical protein